MKKPIYYLLIILCSIISLPSVALAADDKTEMSVNQTMQMVDINKADVESLTSLKGVGEKKAQAIIAYRKSHGDFSSIDDLLNVKGIGEKILLLNKERIKLE